jgi:lysophospholipase L1-like esterase
MRNRSVLSCLLLLASTFSLWAEKRDKEFEVEQERKADLSRLVVVGDSLSAGFQNFSLVQSGQVSGYANLIARQAMTPLTLPLIAEPGIPNKLILIPGPAPTIAKAPGISTGRISPEIQVTNLAVPGHLVIDALARKPSFPIINPVDQVQTLTNLVLGFPGLFGNMALSQVEWVEHFAAVKATSPTTILVWLGNNDALFSVLLADPTLVTPPAIFDTLYTQLIDRLSKTGATLVTANIPDVTAIPFLTPAEKVVLPIAAATSIPPAVLLNLLGLNPGDFLVPGAVAIIRQMAASHALGPLPALCPSAFDGLPAPQTACVLRAAQIASIRGVVRAYNGVIATRASAKGAVVVDISSLLQRIAEQGFEVGGRRLTTDFLGGLFSLDGIHPTNTGYAIIANEFIKTMNRQLDTEIPPVSIEQVAKQDPLL